jgi:hypothetical protein
MLDIVDESLSEMCTYDGDTNISYCIFSTLLYLYYYTNKPDIVLLCFLVNEVWSLNKSTYPTRIEGSCSLKCQWVKSRLLNEGIFERLTGWSLLELKT